MTSFTLSVDGQKPLTGDLSIDSPVLPIPLFQYRSDVEVLGSVRDCASGGCPAVMVLNDQPDTVFDKQWQFFEYAINPGMSLNAIIALMGDQKALMNNTGFGDEGDPRANYLTGNNLSSPLPRLDKLRTFGWNTHTGTVEGEYLVVKTFDGTKPPPLKSGRVYPETLADVKLDDYLITPQTNLEMFLDCSNVKWKADGGAWYGPFANGAIRDWLGDGRIHSFFPLVSRYRVLSPLKNWKRVSVFPSAFGRFY